MVPEKRAVASAVYLSRRVSRVRPSVWKRICVLTPRRSAFSEESFTVP